MTTNLAKVSKDIQNDYGPKDDLNLYRKQFGNLNDCVNRKPTGMVFKMEGTCFKFQHHTKVEAAYQAGVLTDTAWAKFQEGRTSYLIKHLTLCKNNKMNICKKCEAKYFLTANDDDACKAGGAHEPMYDFTKSDNVLECII